jgi:hypothetical protein
MITNKVENSLEESSMINALVWNCFLFKVLKVLTDRSFELRGEIRLI